MLSLEVGIVSNAPDSMACCVVFATLFHHSTLTLSIFKSVSEFVINLHLWNSFFDVQLVSKSDAKLLHTFPFTQPINVKRALKKSP